LKRFGRRVLIKKTVRLINPEAISLGDNVMIDDFVIIHAGEDVELKGNNQIAAHSEIFGRFGVVLERYATLASRVGVYTESDDYSGGSLTNPTIPDRYKPGFHGAPVLLDEFAIVGTNSTLLPGAGLAKGTAVGGHSLVRSALDEWGIYAGVPARFIKPRSRDVLALAKEYETSQ